MKLTLLVLLLSNNIFAFDPGCLPHKPALCKIDPISQDRICEENYEDCEGFEGCTNPENPYLCPNGKCAANYILCEEKYFNCEDIKLFNKPDKMRRWNM